jgi:DNA-directed RNA polymerase subunit RPC12/RpoP
MSATRLTCPSCDETFKSSAEPGDRVKCPHCGKPIRVPEEVEDDREERGERPRKRGKGKKEKAGSSAMLWVCVGGGAVVLMALVGVGGLLVYLAKDRGGGAGLGGGIGLGGGPSEPRPKAYSSPQEVFDAHQAAIKNKDAKEVVNCLTPESRREVLAYTASHYALRRELPKGDAQEQQLRKVTGDVLDRHGLTVEAVKSLPGKPVHFGKETEVFNEALLAKVKDVDAMLIELLSASFQYGGGGLRSSGVPVRTLSDVKVEGDRATGTWNWRLGYSVKNKPVTFRKVGGGWKYSPPLEDYEK